MSTSQTPSTNPSFDEAEQQRREIESTRSDMGHTLEQIEDRVSPERIKERQTQKMRSRWQQARQSVMGSSNDGHGARERLSGATDNARETMQQAPDRLQDSTRGNPMAAGLIALGIGALAGSVLPVSNQERRAAGQLREELEEPMRSQLQDAGQQVTDTLKDDAQHAAEEVKSSAQQAAQRTKDDAQGSAERMKDEAKESSGRDGGSSSSTTTP